MSSENSDFKRAKSPNWRRHEVYVTSHSRQKVLVKSVSRRRDDFSAGVPRMSNALSTVVPTVSVVMPVYNSENYLADSMDSILNQTFLDWELICVDDGSSDGSLEILRCYKLADPRVRVFTRPHTGHASARNEGIAIARGRYIAAMDSDDVALPKRLRLQVDYLESHPECVGLGAAVRIVGPDLMPIKDECPALDHEAIDRSVLAGNCAAIRQCVAMFRTEAVRRVGGYCVEALFHEEADLYLRLAELGHLANLPDILLLYRQWQGSVSHTHWATQNSFRLEVIRDASIRDARIRRGLPVGTSIAKQNSIENGGGRRSWASWSHDAFNSGYRATAQRYAWHAIRSEPLSISSWKAVLRLCFGKAPSARVMW